MGPAFFVRVISFISTFPHSQMLSQDTTPESTSSVTTLHLADIQALGFEFDPDPIASRQTLFKSFYFIQHANDGKPAMRLHISRSLRGELSGGISWCITVYGGTAATTGLVTLINSEASPQDILASETVKPDKVISTMIRLIAEAEEKVRNSSEIGANRSSASQQIGDLIAEDKTIPRPSEK